MMHGKPIAQASSPTYTLRMYHLCFPLPLCSAQPFCIFCDCFFLFYFFCSLPPPPYQSNIFPPRRELQRRLEASGVKNVTSNYVHPGLVRTEIGRHLPTWQKSIMYTLYPLMYIFTKDPYHGAQSSLHACLSPDLEGVGGKYIVECAEEKPHFRADSVPTAQRLYNKSKEIWGLE